MFSIPKNANAREAAYLAALHTGEGSRFAAEMLEQWQADARPDLDDLQLARRIAYGTIQMALALDHLAVQLTDRKHLKLKAKEQVLLRTALYQMHFMQRLPSYAIGNETIRLAKKYCQPYFVSFLNALLRKYESSAPLLPTGSSDKELSIHYSYPQYFIKALKQEHKNFQNLLQLGNEAPTLMVRIRTGNIPEDWTEVIKGPLRVAIPSGQTNWKDLSSSNQYYIQNATQVDLLNYLSSLTPVPRTVMDLCAAPGGKLIAAHDLFPQAKLCANDISRRRLQKLKQNLLKYNIHAELTSNDKEPLYFHDPFDLVIVDAPCSNSGVLNKRPEARWRLTPEQIEALNQEQLGLLKTASELLTDQGHIWYMTCSILKAENKDLIAQACKRLNLEIVGAPCEILPNSQGWDGGFGCVLRTS